MTAQMIEVVCEFANMICGSVVSELENQELVRLSPAIPWDAPAEPGNAEVDLCSGTSGWRHCSHPWKCAKGARRWLDRRRIRVLIVDDSAIVRKILTEALDGEPDIEVVGTAPDPYVARDKILALKPDVLTLDIEMPRMDGLTFLKKLMHFHPLPTVVISSLAQPSCRAAIQALEFGAVEVLAKPGGPYSVGELRKTLAAKIRAAAAARLRSRSRRRARLSGASSPSRSALSRPDAVIAIGASTGGTEASRHCCTRSPRRRPALSSRSTSRRVLPRIRQPAE